MVDYVHSGEIAGRAFLQPPPEEPGGVFDPRKVDFETLPVARGRGPQR